MLGIEAYSVKSGFINGAMTVKSYEVYLETTFNELPNSCAKFNKHILAFVEEYLNSGAESSDYIIDANKASPLIENGELAVMDIRSADDYNKVHIKDAVNIPFGKVMQKSFEDFEGEKIIVICYFGQSAGQKLVVLTALGYNDVSLRSGIKEGWIDEGYPVFD